VRGNSVGVTCEPPKGFEGDGDSENGEERRLFVAADQTVSECGLGEGEDAQGEPAGPGDEAVGVPAMAASSSMPTGAPLTRRHTSWGKASNVTKDPRGRDTIAVDDKECCSAVFEMPSSRRDVK